jgi:hypothetical protein
MGDIYGRGEGEAKVNCPYRECLGERGHASPHLFEAPVIERWLEDAREDERIAISVMFAKKPRLTREALLAAIQQRGAPR